MIVTYCIKYGNFYRLNDNCCTMQSYSSSNIELCNCSLIRCCNNRRLATHTIPHHSCLFPPIDILWPSTILFSPFKHSNLVRTLPTVEYCSWGMCHHHISWWSYITTYAVSYCFGLFAASLPGVGPGNEGVSLRCVGRPVYEDLLFIWLAF